MTQKILDAVEKLVKKIADDEELKAKFLKDPVSVVEKLIGIDLPNDQIDKVVDAVKAKITLDKVDDVIDALGGLGGLFGKK